MILSKQAIEAMPTGSKARKRLAYEFNVHINTVDSWIEDNKEDGPLTRVNALNFISEETGMSQEEILINVNSAA